MCAAHERACGTVEQEAWWAPGRVSRRRRVRRGIQRISVRGNEEWMKAGDGKEAEKKNRSSSIGQLKRERERERERKVW